MALSRIGFLLTQRNNPIKPLYGAITINSFDVGTEKLPAKHPQRRMERRVYFWLRHEGSGVVNFAKGKTGAIL